MSYRAERKLGGHSMARWARWVIGPFLAGPLSAWALGLGEIELKSALNQPLNAEIELVSATSEELESLRVELAPRDTFERYGIDRPAFLSDLLFSVNRNASGGAIVRVASVQSITEPFVTILVEASWARGRLLREYTVLLDPPVLMPAPATQTLVATPATGPARGDQAGRIARPAAAGTPAPTAQPPAPAAREVAPISRPAAGPAGGTYGPVQRDETLWSIAARFRPGDQVSMNQMMLAIYEANPQAFNGNINELRRGAILRLPDLTAATGVSATAARQEVARQNSAWRDSAPAVAAASEPAARLRLVSPDDGSTGTRPAARGADGARVGELEGEVQRLQDELAETQRLINIRDSQLQELQQRLAAAEAAAADGSLPIAEPAPATTSPGVDLEAGELAGEALFADQGEAADVPTVEEPVTQALPEEAVDAEPAPAAVAPPASTRVVTRAPAEPSLLATMLGWLGKPLLWILLGVVALAGTAVWYLRHRQESVEDITGRWEALEAEAEHEFATDATDQLRAPLPAADEGFVVVEQPTEAEQTQPGLEVLPELPAAASLDEETLSSQTAIDLDQADPVAEADFHMAYGLYDQAADLLSKALAGDPDRRDLKMKLLEVFFVWGNHDQFLETAQSLHGDMGESGDPDWDKIVIMGRQICPDAELFAQAPAPSADMVDLDLEVGAGSELDFSLDEEAAGEVDFDLDFGAVDETGVAGGEAELMAAIRAEPASESAPTDAADTFSGSGPDLEDLDIGAQTAAGLEAAMLGDLAPPEAESEAESPLDLPEFADLDLPDDAQFLEGEAATAEMPTFETPAAAESTADLPTIETPAAAESTADMPAIETPAAAEFAADDFTADMPAIETPAADDFTADMPAIETPAAAEFTADMPTLEGLAGPSDSQSMDTPAADFPTMEMPSMDAQGPVSGTEQLPTLDEPAAAFPPSSMVENTAEINLDDLGLDIEGLADELPQELALDDTPLPAEDLLSATGVTEMLGGDQLDHVDSEVLPEEEATPFAHSLDEGAHDTAEIFAVPDDGEDEVAIELPIADEDDLDLNLDDLDLAVVSLEGDTVEQPAAEEVAFSEDVFDAKAAAAAAVDLDIGGAVIGTADFSPSEEVLALDPQTMTEVGTKLDLARAYIDMGDPEGARSILEEVLQEGDQGQRQEAEGLMESLSA